VQLLNSLRLHDGPALLQLPDNVRLLNPFAAASAAAAAAAGDSSLTLLEFSDEVGEGGREG